MIYAALNTLRANGEDWDAYTFSDYLHDKGKLVAAGGPLYISDLTTGIPRNTAISSHIQKVREIATRRRVVTALTNGLLQANDAATPTEALIAEALAQLNLVANGFDEHGNLLPYSLSSNTVTRHPELLCLANVEGLKPEWLWEPYLPVGTLSMLSGDPGGGKTFISLAIAAALSRGLAPHTNESRKAMDTIYLSVENSPEYVIRPRFDLLKGDPARFHLLPGMFTTAGKSKQRSSLTLKDLDVFEKALARTKAALLIVDPIQSYLGAEVDAYRSNETRPVLDGLATLARDNKCCILLVRHLSKSSGGRAIHRGLGSIDLAGAVRSELIAGATPDDANRRALVQIKSNYGRFGDPLGYKIDDSGFTWTGKSDLTEKDILSSDAEADGRTEIAEACDYLRGQLASGPKLQKELEAGSGFTERTLQRAAKRIDVKRSRDGERGPWLWSLQ